MIVWDMRWEGDDCLIVSGCVITSLVPRLSVGVERVRVRGYHPPVLSPLPSLPSPFSADSGNSHYVGLVRSWKFVSTIHPPVLSSTAQ